MLVTELLNGGSLQEKLHNGLFTWYKGCVSPPAHDSLASSVAMCNPSSLFTVSAWTPALRLYIVH